MRAPTKSSSAGSMCAEMVCSSLAHTPQWLTEPADPPEPDTASPDEPRICSGGMSMPSANRRTASLRSSMALSSISDQNWINFFWSTAASAMGSASTMDGKATSVSSSMSMLDEARLSMNCSASFICAMASAPPSTASDGGGGKVRLSGRNQTPADMSRDRTWVKMCLVSHSISASVGSRERNGDHASRRFSGSGFHSRMTGSSGDRVR